MQSRLLAFFLPVFLLTAAALGILLAVESAQRISLEAQTNRIADAKELLAAVIDEAAATGEIQLPAPASLQDDSPDADSSGAGAEVDQYLMVVGGAVSPEQQPQGRALERIDAALDPDTVIWPWTDGDFVATEEARIDGLAVSVLLLEPVDRVRGDVTRRWVLLAAAVATVMALIALGTYPLARWALRPIDRLETTARALAGGDMSARAEVDAGPPEIRRLASSLNAMAERVDAGLHRERAFVASASHHFGNLLTPLRLRMETIDRNQPPGTPGVDRAFDSTIEEAMAELDRLEAAAERLLQLNRAEEDELQPIAVDVGVIVDESLQSWQVVAESKGIQLTRAGSDKARAWASRGAIEETLDNLIDNAMKYAEGTEITLGVMRGLHNVRVVVSDRGPGLTDQEIEQAQGRFWRGATHQNKPGSGLGLAIVDALAAQCGGHFEIRNGPDGGLEAALVLKRAQP